jgi:Na+/proline symporter
MLESLTLDQKIVIIFLSITLLIGVLASRSIKNFKDYALSKNRYNLIAITFTLIATMVGGASTSGTIAEIYEHGLLYAVASTGFIVGIILLAKFIAPKFDNRFDGMVSSSDMIQRYFGNKAEKLSAFVSCIQCLGTIAAQIVVLGHLSNTFFDISYDQSVIIMGSIITIYSLIGGIKAVTNTDIFQFIMIFIAFPIIANISVSKAGGILEIFLNLPEKYTVIFENNNFKKHLFLFIFWATPFSLIYPVIIHRLLIAKNPSDIVKMSYTYALFKIVLLFVLIAIAFSALVLYPNINSKAVVPVIIKNLLPIGFSGIAISGIIAVTMSSADSFLNTASVILTKNLGNSTKLKNVKFNTLLLGIFAIMIAMQDYNIINVSVIMNTLIYLSVSIPLFFVIYKIKINNNTYWLSILIGAVAFAISGYYYKLGYEACFIAEISCLITYGVYFVLGVKDISYFSKFKQIFTWIISINIPYICKKVLYKVRKIILQLLDEAYEVTQKQYLQFSIFFCVTYTSSYFMWVTKVIDKNIIVLRIISGLLTLGLLARDKFQSVLSKRFYAIYWYVSLIVCLPLLATVIFFLETNSLSGVVNISFSVFLLSILVSWRMFLALVFIGVGLGYLYTNAFFIYDKALSEIEIYILAYSLFISIAIGLVFSRSKEISILEQINKMKYMGMQIAHEVRVPLSDVSISIQIIRKIFRKLKLQNKNKKIIFEINQKDFNILRDTINNCPDKVKIGSDIVTNLLLSLKKGLLISKSDYCSVKELLKEVAGQYKCLIDFNDIGKSDINFYGSKLYMIHCFHNIIKNAIKYALVNKNNKLKIYIEKNILIFEDKGPGIMKSDLKKIFEAFNTSSDSGSGLGLIFCKDVMKSINGNIECESSTLAGTKIKLIFPNFNL